MQTIGKIKCSKNKECYGGYAGERTWFCDEVEKVVVEHKTYNVKPEHGFDLDMAMDSFSSKLIYCKSLGKIRIP